MPTVSCGSTSSITKIYRLRIVSSLTTELETSPDGCRPKYPLIFEIKYGDEWLAIQVMDDDRNTDVNARDAEGSTALFWAAKRGYYDLADRLRCTTKTLISGDADSTAALKEAVKQGHRDIVNLFLEHTDDWTVVDKTSPRHQRSVFYLVPESRRDEPLVFHAGYLGRVPGGDALFVAQKREDALIETYFGDLALVGYQGIVGQKYQHSGGGSVSGCQRRDGSRAVGYQRYKFCGLSTAPPRGIPGTNG